LAAIDSAESIVWEGRRPLRKVRLTSLFILGLFVLVVVNAEGYLGYFQNAAKVDIFLLGLFLVGMISLGVERGFHYYITNWRIVKTWDFLWWRRRWDLPLQSVTEIALKRIRRKTFVIFISSSGLRAIVFVAKDDAERIREIALRAKSMLTAGQ
jgi:hypothetical protein